VLYLRYDHQADASSFRGWRVEIGEEKGMGRSGKADASISIL
jgi:hypothetical protein